MNISMQIHANFCYVTIFFFSVVWILFAKRIYDIIYWECFFPSLSIFSSILIFSFSFLKFVTSLFVQRQMSTETIYTVYLSCRFFLIVCNFYYFAVSLLRLSLLLFYFSLFATKCLPIEMVFEVKWPEYNIQVRYSIYMAMYEKEREREKKKWQHKIDWCNNFKMFQWLILFLQSFFLLSLFVWTNRRCWVYIIFVCTLLFFELYFFGFWYHFLWKMTVILHFIPWINERQQQKLLELMWI